jgi:hypothetical protein
MSQSTKRIIKVISKILKFAASQLDVLLKEEEEMSKGPTIE